MDVGNACSTGTWLYRKIKDIQNSSSTQLLKLSEDGSDVLCKINDFNGSCAGAFAFPSCIIGMWLEIVNVIDFAISWRYLVDSGFCTG